jgi:hypothetical protein
MFDPGALGTLIIGLDDVHRRTEAETGYPLAGPRFEPARPTNGMRARIADRLRAVADWFQPAGQRAPAGTDWQRS